MKKIFYLFERNMLVRKERIVLEIVFNGFEIITYKNYFIFV